MKKLGDTLVKIEKLHQDSFGKYGHLRAPEFLAQRKELLKELDSHLFGSRNLKGLATFDGHPKLKNALGISSRSLVHHWRKAGGAGAIPGYSEHVKAIAKATGWMKTGGYIGIGIGGVSGVMAIKEVCANGDDQQCRKAMITEGGKFLGASYGGYKFGGLAAGYAASICVFVGVPTAGVGAVVCAGTVVGLAALAGTVGGAALGEWAGEVIYEHVVD
ncbi:putative uncharacterized protein [Pseudomonas sp. StFLB209]|uniref:hypothetical protein n=1 Tax=Pseudomonas sp. StFLB209 TaxID=1028989 RepID=UPI0004F6F3FD|nr:hypothetical protein [Pseudomonas sp. StFLB209]BAP42763.1 putative uncharacterized protein [Pseudomonas sp. StFLB209]